MSSTEAPPPERPAPAAPATPEIVIAPQPEPPTTTQAPSVAAIVLEAAPAVVESPAPAEMQAAPAAEPPPVSSAPVQAAAPDDATCKALAQQRAADSAAYDYDEEAQQEIYRGTYASCMEWHQKHS
jgi:hypothetical protein